MSLAGNRGEWSEIYTLFKILGDKCLYPGNDDLEKIEELIYPVVKILRTETSGSYEYYLDQDLVIVTSNKKELLRIPIEEFKSSAIKLFEEIKRKKGAAFTIPEIEKFMVKARCESIKAKSSKKTDITIVIHDDRTGQQPILGFSIKSQLGKAAHLLNATIPTNFQYTIKGPGLTDSQVDEINAINERGKFKKRIFELDKYDCALEFNAIKNKIFSNNLSLIDSALPRIISSMLLEYYKGNASKITDLISILNDRNPIGFDFSNNHNYYAYKLKHLFTDVALGMLPSKVWNGEYDATGGYLVVKEDGDLLCYHIYNKNQFEEYLINNTKLETGSSTKHKFGKIYKEDNKLFMNLNLAIRFLK